MTIYKESMKQASEHRDRTRKDINTMDHLGVLREKVGRLRAEIARIQELSQQYRSRHRNGGEAQVAHGKRQERLQGIQQELSQLANLSGTIHSTKKMKEKLRSRLHLIRNAQAA
jgi:hypothetical protein